MSNRNFDGRAIIQRLQNKVYARNLYANNTTGQPMINNPQTTDGNSSKYVSYHSGAQTEYARGLSGNCEAISLCGIAGIPPFPTPPAPPTPSGTAPDAPTNLVATPGNGQVTISFTQGSDGGSPIINYQYSLNGGPFLPFITPITTSPVVISGLTNGTNYVIRLKAVNIIDPSVPSSPVSATPAAATAPDAPTNLVATPCNSEVYISFTQGSDGGSPIINYQYSLDGGPFIAFVPSITTSPVVITGLTIGITYSIRLKAVNIIDPSVPSSDVSVTPFPATVPDAPTDEIVTPGNGEAIFTFTQGSDGGCPITNYEYSIVFPIYIPISPPIASSPVIVTGLTNGTQYDMSIRPVNAVGPGPGTPYLSVTPFIPPLLFTTVGTTLWTAPIGFTSVTYLVVGGGGGGGGGYDTGAGGGGGGGMVLSGTHTVVPGNTYTIVVGDGGIGGVSNVSIPSETNGSSGQNSEFDSIVSLGGTGGFASRNPPGSNNGAGGLAAINPTTASQGGRGGLLTGGGGGGGSLGNGANSVSNTGALGGVGTFVTFMYDGVQYGRGGRGANRNTDNGPIVSLPNTGNGGRGSGAAAGSQTNGAKGSNGVVALVF